MKASTRCGPNRLCTTGRGSTKSTTKSTIRTGQPASQPYYSML